MIYSFLSTKATVDDAGAAKLLSLTFEGNTAGRTGGAIFLQRGYPQKIAIDFKDEATVIVKNNKVIGSAARGGGIVVDSCATDENPPIDCTAETEPHCIPTVGTVMNTVPASCECINYDEVTERYVAVQSDFLERFDSTKYPGPYCEIKAPNNNDCGTNYKGRNTKCCTDTNDLENCPLNCPECDAATFCPVCDASFDCNCGEPPSKTNPPTRNPLDFCTLSVSGAQTTLTMDGNSAVEAAGHVFLGQNWALVVQNGATANINNGKVDDWKDYATTQAVGGGVFSMGERNSPVLIVKGANSVLTFTGNTALSAGAGIYGHEGGSIEVLDGGELTLESNELVCTANPTVVADLSACSIAPDLQNPAQADVWNTYKHGGGVHLITGNTILISGPNSRMNVNNNVGGRGGGVFIKDNAGSLLVTNKASIHFNGNKAWGYVGQCVVFKKLTVFLY